MFFNHCFPLLPGHTSESRTPRWGLPFSSSAARKQSSLSFKAVLAKAAPPSQRPPICVTFLSLSIQARSWTDMDQQSTFDTIVIMPQQCPTRTTIVVDQHPSSSQIVLKFQSLFHPRLLIVHFQPTHVTNHSKLWFVRPSFPSHTKPLPRTCPHRPLAA